MKTTIQRKQRRTIVTAVHALHYIPSPNQNTTNMKKKSTLASILIDISAPLDQVRGVVHVQAVHNRRVAKMRRALRPEPDPDAADPELQLKLD